MIIPIDRPNRTRQALPRRAARELRAPAAPVVPLSPDVLGDIAAGIAAAEPLWRSVVRHHAHHREPVRLLATPAYEVWVIGWMPNQAVELHDHGDAVGVLVVTEGELTEVRAEEGALATHPLPQGSGHHLRPGLVHDVVNTGRAPATSIHVYSPPLSTMTHYDPVTLLPVLVEAVAPEPTVLSPTDGSAVLHPSAAVAAAARG